MTNPPKVARTLWPDNSLAPPLNNVRAAVEVKVPFTVIVSSPNDSLVLNEQVESPPIDKLPPTLSTSRVVTLLTPTLPKPINEIRSVATVKETLALVAIVTVAVPRLLCVLDAMNIPPVYASEFIVIVGTPLLITAGASIP